VTIVRPIKHQPAPGVPRIEPAALTIERLRYAMDAKAKPPVSTMNVIDLLTKAKNHG
jgi:hypothetical protein